MPVAPVNDNGAVLYFEDTGAPDASSTYVTVFMVHGTAINSGIFRPMIPYAAENNFRLVLVNLRDYKGSTPYTEAEIAAIRSEDPKVQALALEERGLELARFMVRFIEKEDIPPIAEGKALTGGISLVGWSAGNCQTLPVLAHAERFPEEIRTVLDKHLRSVVMYDASLYSIGGVAPNELYSPFRDQSMSVPERVAIFPLWVSTYYPQLSGLATDMRTLVETLQVRQKAPLAAAECRPTIQRLTPAEAEDIMETNVMDSSQLAIMGIQRSIFADNLRHALCYVEDGEAGLEVVWPGVKLQVIWCDMTQGDAVAAAQMVRDHYESIRQKGGFVRNMEIFKLQGANHFPHWDKPEELVKALTTIV